ncbi:CarD family transcriptional regulator [Deinobacterium chartae]|uniref:CarD family transcriptional regulator n=1 Tax=Deinobacterium chartae TaxID=521158 RepID=A0A841HYY1_9DEIO|nr:CarD family transcriptional regulator [Deinobacterium chartae]MBB6097429.1 CarD family transcriptional regulator [Deinobacterium chartae]
MSEATALKLNVGDSVVYPNHGAGKILGVSEREVMGRTQDYFEIELLQSGMQVSVPVNHADTLGLRRITPQDEIPRLLSAFTEPDLDLPAAWTPRHRREQALLQEGDVFKIARLVGTLYRRALGRSLAVTERAIFDEAKRMIATEVAVALGLDLKEAEGRIETLLEGSAAA